MLRIMEKINFFSFLFFLSHSSTPNLEIGLFFSQLIHAWTSDIVQYNDTGCNVNNLKTLSYFKATITNFSTNFITYSLIDIFFFHESLSF